MPFLRALSVSIGGSLAANLLLLVALRPLVIDPAMPLEILSVGAITVFTIGGAAAATLAYAVLRAVLARPNRAFVILSAIVLVASFIPDYLIIGQTTGKFAGGNTGSALVLMLMHVVEAAVVVLALTKLWGPRNG